MYQNKRFYIPTKIYFETGITDRLKDILKDENFKRALLICDSFFEENGTAEEIKNKNDAVLDIFSDFTPNPMLSKVEKASKLLKELDADCVIALGGGSCLDLAKFASAYRYADGKIQDYFFGKKKFEKHIPLIAIPTTAGTGSEVTCVSVCNDDISGIKSPLNDEKFYPYISIVDPRLTLSVPPFVTATTGLDAMAHALEAYWCCAHRDITDTFAVASLKSIFGSLEQAYSDTKRQNIEARREMSKGSLFAGLAFSQTKTAAVHACSYPLSSNFYLSHGEACAFTLDLFLLENAKFDKRIETLAKELGFVNVDEMASKIKYFKKKFKLKTTLADLGCKDSKKLAEECLAHPLYNNNPVKHSVEELAALLEELK
ncbi:MAG: iron-containing alcohol dehydrogenase [Methanosarcinaceae archaeon]|nr:iron-containing alcohol dehydrogenase [Methanosarcinaceae archaeon]